MIFISVKYLSACVNNINESNINEQQKNQLLFLQEISSFFGSSLEI